MRTHTEPPAGQDRAERETALSSFAQLRTAMNGPVILHGTVFSTEEISGHATDASGRRIRLTGYMPAVLLDGQYKVRISLAELVDPALFGPVPADLSDEAGRRTFVRRQKRIADSYLGMELPFVITEILGTPEEPAVLGSRRRALEILARRNYGGEEPAITAGSIVEADIIASGLHSVWVCCGGVDTQIFRSQLSYDFVPVVKDRYRVGGKLPVMVKAVDFAPDGRVAGIRASATAAFLEASKARQHLIAPQSTAHAVISSVSDRGDGRIRAAGMIRPAQIAVLISEFRPSDLAEPPRSGDTVKVFVRGYMSSGLAVCTYQGRVGSPAFAEDFR